MTSLIDHLEGTLGLISRGWATGPDGERMPFQIVRLSRGSGEGNVGYATLGLSRTGLTSPTSGRCVHQELLMLGPRGSPERSRSLLAAPCGMRRSRGATHRSAVMCWVRQAAWCQDRTTALHVAMPVYFSEEFAAFSRWP